MAELDEMAKGAFQEAGNIGMGHLATELSQILERGVKIDIPTVEALPISKIIEQASEGSKKSVVGIHLDLSGDVSGGTLILLPRFSAFSFSDLLLKKSIGSTNAIEEKERMKLKEMGVRLCNSYIRAVNEFLGINMNVGNPEIVVNMDGVGDFINKQIGGMADEFIEVKGEGIVPTTKSVKEFKLLFEPDASDVIMATVMKKMMG